MPQKLGSNEVSIGKGGLSPAEVVDIVEVLRLGILLHQGRRREVGNLLVIWSKLVIKAHTTVMNKVKILQDVVSHSKKGVAIVHPS